MKVILQDMSSDQTLPVLVKGEEGSLDIHPEGCGTANGRDLPPIFLEMFEGKLVLRVWSDINQEDPTHVIDMSKAFIKKGD